MSFSGTRLLPATILSLTGLLLLKFLVLVHAAVPELGSWNPTSVAVPTAGPTSVIPSPPPTEAERHLLEQLAARRGELDQRERVLSDRETALAAAEVKLSQWLSKLTELRQQLEELYNRRQREADDSWKGLVKLYESMKPRDAAQIFDDLDMPVLLELTRRMNERKAAAILGSMQPDRARELTAHLATKGLVDASAADPRQ